MMEYRDQMFQSVLANYPIRLIRKGFIEHIKRKSNLPTPSDIVNIIDPSEPEPDWAAYVGIRSKIKENVFITDVQREYLRWCEGRAVNGLSKWRDKITELEKCMVNKGEYISPVNLDHQNPIFLSSDRLMEMAEMQV